MATIVDALRPPMEHICSQCGKSFVQRPHLLRHVRRQHGGVWRCVRCSSTFNREANYIYHTRVCEFHSCGKRPAEAQIGGGVPKRQKGNILDSNSHALEHTMDQFTVNLEEVDQTPETIIDILKNNIMNLKLTIEVEQEALKIAAALHVVFHQATDPTFLSEPPPVFKTTPIEILTATDIDEVPQTIMEQLLKKIDEFETRGSGWILHELSRLDLHTYVYDPLCASTFIPLPEDLKAKRAVVNIQNKV